MGNKPRAKMPISERAKQFSPFAAVRGLDMALRRQEKMAVSRVALSEEMAEELNQKLIILSKDDKITLTYYFDEEYRQLTGVVSKMDMMNRVLRMENRQIPFDDILDISSAEGDEEET